VNLDLRRINEYERYKKNHEVRVAALISDDKPPAGCEQ